MREARERAEAWEKEEDLKIKLQEAKKKSNDTEAGASAIKGYILDTC